MAHGFMIPMYCVRRQLALTSWPDRYDVLVDLSGEASVVVSEHAKVRTAGFDEFVYGATKLNSILRCPSVCLNPLSLCPTFAQAYFGMTSVHKDVATGVVIIVHSRFSNELPQPRLRL